VMVENGFPFFRKRDYHPDVGHGKIAIVFHCEAKLEAVAYDAMKQLGAAEVSRSEGYML